MNKKEKCYIDRFGGCCCVCKHHYEDYHHCINKKDDKNNCVCNELKGYICLISFEGEKPKAHSNWPKHSYCDSFLKY